MLISNKLRMFISVSVTMTHFLRSQETRQFDIFECELTERSVGNFFLFLFFPSKLTPVISDSGGVMN